MTELFQKYWMDKVLLELQKFSVYNRELGGFIRTAARSGPSSQQKIGELVGSVNKSGHRKINIFGCAFYLHHLVWAVEHGEWPTEDLDHRDQNPANNRIGNLRLGPEPINGKNRPMFSNNTSGYTGVSFDPRRGKYRAEVSPDGKRYWCGYHNTAEEAAAARQVLITAHPEWGFTELHGL
jgi:hypothetical protein